MHDVEKKARANESARELSGDIPLIPYFFVPSINAFLTHF